MSDLDPVKPLTAFGPALTTVPTDGAIRRMAGAYGEQGSPAGMTRDVRNLMRGPGPNVAAANTLTVGAVTPQTVGQSIPEQSTLTPASQVPRVVRNVPIGPDPLPAMNTADTAGGGAIMYRTPRPTRPNSPGGPGIDWIPSYEAPAATIAPAASPALPVGNLATPPVGQTFDQQFPVRAPVAKTPVVNDPEAYSVGNAGPATPGAGDISGYGRKGAELPGGVTYDTKTKTYSNVRPGGGPITAMNSGGGSGGGGTLSVIPVAPGGGYSGTPGFTASGGNVSPTAGVSAALAAAADRGDFKSIADHYQKGGGTFNGETAADVRAANLREQISMTPVGTKRRAALVSELQAAQAGEIAKTAQQQAGTKLASDTAATAAGIEKSKADTAATNLANQTRQKSQDMLAQLAQLDNSNDPDGSQRRAIQENLLVVMHGKDPAQDKFIQYEEGTGNFDQTTGKEQLIKRLYNTRKEQTVSTGRPNTPPKGVEGQIMRDANGNRMQFKGGKWTELK